jgi:5'-nucleotidase
MPLRVMNIEPGLYSVIGTPTDCVHLSVSGLFDTPFDMVVSGINDGPNLGDDVLYSGTVAAAIEGRFLGLPTVALSLCASADSGHHYDTAARIARQIVSGLLRRPLESELVLNVNVPDLPWQQLRGVVATRLGRRHESEPVVPASDPRGRPVYWIGAAGPGRDVEPGTDFHAIANHQVSVTPLTVDMTRHVTLPLLGSWLSELA